MIWTDDRSSDPGRDTHNEKPRFTWSTATCADSATAVVGATAVAIACLVFGRWQFGGFDHSVLIDMGWRLTRCQQPYVDFPCTVPVWWMAGIGATFRLLGPSWLSGLVLNAAFAAATSLWAYWLLMQIWPCRLRSLLVTLALQAGTTVVTSYWWYNPMTSIAACVFHLSLVALATHPHKLALAVSCALALALMLGCKPNVAGPLALASAPVLVIATRSPLRTSLICGGGVLLACSGLALIRAWPTDVIDAYRGVAARGLSLATLATLIRDMDPLQRVIEGQLLIACIVAGGLVMAVHRAYLSFAGWIALPTCLAAGIGALTNGEMKIIDMTPMLCAIWTTYSATYNHATERRSGLRVGQALDALITVLIAAWIGYGFAVGASRERVKAIGPFYATTTATERPQTKFFWGLSASEEFMQTEEEVARALRRFRPANVFFGPRMQWAYAAFDQESPLGEPVWWHPGVSFPWHMETDYEKRWLKSGHDVLIFYANDFTYLSARMMNSIVENYELVPGYRRLTVLVAKEREVGRAH